jgi:CRP-like cAMP-binding protein
MIEEIHRKLIELTLFKGVPDAEVRWVTEHSHIEPLADGEFFHREGEPVDKFYVVLEGELQVTQRIEGRETVIGTTPVGIMGGELALLLGDTSVV